ncbi:MAG: ATP-binding protein [Eubacteriales bacterium]|nr:ATP-binding protein [Eubacteriales bacterium]MDD4323645.1 ATP-binding protein [Eubacteriales bacterium]MDD4540843.1 ATP-binding protein [Eubacteriales bacterium]
MRRRSLMIFSVILLLVALGLGNYIAIREARNLSTQATMNYVRATANWLKTEFDGGKDWAEIIDEASNFYSNFDIPLSVSILRNDGSVLYESGVDSRTSNYRYLDPEIQAVMRDGGEARDIRHFNYLGQEMLFLASSFDPYIVRVAIPLASESSSLNIVTLNVIVISLIVVVIYILAFSYFFKGVRAPLVEFRDKVVLLQKGDYSSRTESTNTPYDQINQLAIVYNETAEVLEEQHIKLLDSEKFLNVLINSLSEPLVVCNRQGDVTFINVAAMDVFQRFIDPSERNYPLYFLIHSEDVASEILEVLKGGRPEKLDRKLNTADGIRDFSVIISPFRGDQVVIVFHDRTAEARAEQFRSDFVANVTHELRTPLTSIRGFIDTIIENPDMDSKQRLRFLELMNVEAMRLERLIRDLLALSDIEQDDSLDQLQAFSLDDLIQEVILQFESAAADNNISLNFRSGTNTTIIAERDRIKQLLINLVDNAITYNHAGGFVNISYEIDEDRRTVCRDSDKKTLKLIVSDNGIGIKIDDQKRIFERFFRVDKSRSSSAESTGLGLSIVKHIVRQYDGEIELDSTWGQGSTFIVTLFVEADQV